LPSVAPAKPPTLAVHAPTRFTAGYHCRCSTCKTPSVLSWIAILSQTSSRSRFANIGATKLPRLFCTARFRLHRCCPNTRRHFAASEEPRHAIAFQGRQGAEPTIIRQRGGEGGANHVSH